MKGISYLLGASFWVGLAIGGGHPRNAFDRSESRSRLGLGLTPDWLSNNPALHPRHDAPHALPKRSSSSDESPHAGSAYLNNNTQRSCPPYMNYTTFHRCRVSSLPLSLKDLSLMGQQSLKSPSTLASPMPGCFLSAASAMRPESYTFGTPCTLYETFCFDCSFSSHRFFPSDNINATDEITIWLATTSLLSFKFGIRLTCRSS